MKYSWSSIMNDVQINYTILELFWRVSIDCGFPWLWNWHWGFKLLLKYNLSIYLVDQSKFWRATWIWYWELNVLTTAAVVHFSLGSENSTLEFEAFSISKMKTISEFLTSPVCPFTCWNNLLNFVANSISVKLWKVEKYFSDFLFEVFVKVLGES